MSRTFKLSVLAAGLLAAAPFAQAFEAGDFALRMGAVTVQPDASSDDVSVGGTKLDGWKVDVDDNTQLGIRFTYMVTDHIGVGVLGATPFKHNIKGDDALEGADLGSTKHLPPTVTLQYYPLASSSSVQPYAGIGVNYTTFFEEDTSDTLTSALGAASTDLELDDSVGLALELGVDYMLSDNFGLNAAMWWADIDTDATIKAYDAAGNHVATGKTEVEIDPMVYMVGFTYKF